MQLVQLHALTLAIISAILPSYVSGHYKPLCSIILHLTEIVFLVNFVCPHIVKLNYSCNNINVVIHMQAVIENRLI